MESIDGECVETSGLSARREARERAGSGEKRGGKSAEHTLGKSAESICGDKEPRMERACKESGGGRVV